MKRILGLTCLALAACSVDLEVQDGAMLSCTTDAHCPSGFTCKESLERCFRSGGDDRAPTITAGSPSIAPATAGLAGSVDIAFTVDEPLFTTPLVTLHLPAPVVLEATSVHDERYGFSFHAAAGMPEGEVRITAELTDLAGNTAPEAFVGNLRLDFTLPELVGSPIVTEPLVAAGGVTRICVTADEVVATTPEIRLVWVDGAEQVAVADGRDGEAYCALHAAAGEPLEEGDARVAVLLTDLAGNTNDVYTATAVRFDFTPPALLAETTALTLSPPATSSLVTVQSAASGATARVAFGVSEALAELPVVHTSGAETLDFALESQVGSTYVFTLVVPDGAERRVTLPIVASVEDAAGNSAELFLANVVIDTEPPPAPVADRLLYERVPWGSEATGGVRRFTLAGSSAAVEAGAVVRVFDAADISVAAEIGRTTAGGNGAWAPFELHRLDRADVYVVAVDDAGNASDASTATRAGRKRWTATLAGKLAGSVLANPHDAVTTQQLGDFVPDDASVAVAAGTALARDDAASLDLTALVRARRHAASDIPSARLMQGMATDTRRGRVVMFGGFDEGGGVDDTWEWDGQRWLRQAPLLAPPARVGAVMAYDAARSETLLFGGGASECPLGRCGDTWAWDGTTWRAAAETGPAGRTDTAMVYDPARGRVVLFGGMLDLVMFPPPLVVTLADDTWEWDGDGWTPLDPAVAPVPRSEHALGWDGNVNRVVLYGGASAASCPGSAGYHCDDTWEWDGVEWVEVSDNGPRPPPLVGAELLWDPAGARLLLFGGGDAAMAGSRLFERGLWGAAVCADPLRPCWREIAVAPDGAGARRSHSLVWDVRNRAPLLFGGLDGGHSDDTWLLQGNAWLQVGPWTVSPGTRSYGSMAYDSARQRAVLFGGYDCTQPGCSDVWEWNGAIWERVTPSGASPAMRYQAHLAYDAARERVVLFGGASIVPDCGAGAFDHCADTWEWDGTTWSNVTPVTTPTPRRTAAMAADPERSRIVLFGGTGSGSTTLGDTWEWGLHGASVCGAAATPCWQDAQPTPSPATRNSAMAAFDPGADAVLLFGGMNVGSADTWLWSGSGWQDATPLGASPDLRSGAMAVADTHHGRVVMFGGLAYMTCPGEGYHCNDVWEWGAWGASCTPASRCWRPIELTGLRPKGRYGASAAYDPIREEMVIHGGTTFAVCTQAGSRVCDDTWVLDLSTARSPAVVLTFDWASSLGSRDDVSAVSVHAVAGGRGFASEVEVMGAALRVWDATAGEWIAWGENDAGADAPDDLDGEVADASAARRLFAIDDRLRFAVVPLESGAVGGAPAVELDYFEVSVEYSSEE